ncbi:phage head completion protein [Salininema proteolyticum]|uniref:Head-tail adaptor protein n=1 Tax=Salininema proteolyticum TaxID=1607685 RepID=A0ABV8TTD0_9ACTN
MISHLLNQALTHQRPTTVPDGAGGSTTTMVDLAVKACRVSQSTASERLYGAQAQADHAQPIYFAPGEDVRKDDQLGDDDGRAWRVTAVIRPSKAAYVRADVELIETRGAP